MEDARTIWIMAGQPKHGQKHALLVVPLSDLRVKHRVCRVCRVGSMFTAHPGRLIVKLTGVPTEWLWVAPMWHSS
jgi:hypothetical protein